MPEGKVWRGMAAWQQQACRDATTYPASPCVCRPFPTQPICITDTSPPRYGSCQLLNILCFCPACHKLFCTTKSQPALHMPGVGALGGGGLLAAGPPGTALLMLLLPVPASFALAALALLLMPAHACHAAAGAAGRLLPARPGSCRAPRRSPRRASSSAAHAGGAMTNKHQP